MPLITKIFSNFHLEKAVFFFTKNFVLYAFYELYDDEDYFILYPLFIFCYC